jgi:hypothetical protein
MRRDRSAHVDYRAIHTSLVRGLNQFDFLSCRLCGSGEVTVLSLELRCLIRTILTMIGAQLARDLDRIGSSRRGGARRGSLSHM